MADRDTSILLVKQKEGGYNRPYGLPFCGVGSGETYVGIDRNCFYNWPGWRVIDGYKRRFRIANEQVIADDTLDYHVNQWYINFLGKLVNLELIENQTLADFVADFLVHKQYDAIKVINYVARQLQPGIATAYIKITQAVIDLMNRQPANFYNRLYQERINYYLDPFSFGSLVYFSRSTVQAFLNRVATFPAILPASYLDYWDTGWMFQ